MPLLSPPWAGAFPPSAHLPWRPLGIAHIPISAQETEVPSVPDNAKDVVEFSRN